MRGRKPAPREAKVIRGTFRKDRDRGEPARARSRAREDAAVFAPPADLADRALELFHDLVAELRAAGTLDPAYRRTIAHLARLEARAEQMRRSIGRRFVLRTAKDEETGRRGFAKNQALAQLSDLEAHLTRLYGILGLTPEGIVRAPKQKGEGDGGENPFAEFRS